jgi:small subunit ribosomal protein S17
MSDLSTSDTSGSSVTQPTTSESTTSEPTTSEPTTSEPVGSSAVRGFRKTRDGLVVSDKMNKTVVVAVEDRVQHPLYKKTLRRTNKLKAHDEQNACGVGDRVRLMETRPLSASKRWRVVEVLEKAK